MKTAILYQVKEAPAVGNIRKPMKEGGYSDSGADIAFTLRKYGETVITPVPEPSEENNFDWVFGDDESGIEKAIAMGADTLWLNTVLYSGHPIEKYKRLRLIGQRPSDVQKYDDKLFTNRLLLKAGLPVVSDISVCSADEYKGIFPCVIKPIRGRGSQGVSVAGGFGELTEAISRLNAARIYGDEFMIEPYLGGDEITVAVFPADSTHDKPYCLPPVWRFNHIGGIAPYSGKVAVSKNSRADKSDNYRDILRACEAAFGLLRLKAPIRIDCRKGADDKYYMFDINMKPNMTLGERAHRSEQDSLVMIAAAAAGMTRHELLKTFLGTAWINE